MTHFILFTGFLWTFNLPPPPPPTPTPTNTFRTLCSHFQLQYLYFHFFFILFFFIIEQKHFTNVSNITLYFIFKNTKIIPKILPKLKENKRIFPSASMFYPVTVHIIFLVSVQFYF